MNDRYLFKAKTCNGEWVTGLLAHKDNKYYISNKAGMPFAFEVRPDTICQCTGLKDKNRTLIWENDIVVIPREDGYFSVDWDEDTARFVMNGDGLTVDFDNYWSHEVEVVGNRFDNPELLRDYQ